MLKNGMVFIHVPLTGGTHLCKTFNRLNLVSYELNVPREDYAFLNGRTSRFAFVRHPWKWLLAYYRRKRTSGIDETVAIDLKMVKTNWNFNRWIKSIYDSNEPIVSEMMFSHVGRGSSRIEFVGHHETMADDLNCLFGDSKEFVGKLIATAAPPLEHHTAASLNSFWRVVHYEQPIIQEFYQNAGSSPEVWFPAVPIDPISRFHATCA